MNKLAIFSSVAVAAIATGLSATAVAAVDSPDPKDDFALEAQGQFAGIDTEAYVRSVELPADIDVAEFLARQTYEAVPVQPDPELVVRDDIGINGAVDVNNTLPSVVQLFRRNNATGGVSFNCTGTIINPRTVLTAAHCVNPTSSENYGVRGAAPFSILVATGVDTRSRIINNIVTGANYANGGVATSTDVVIHSSSNPGDGGLPFPYADVAFVALDAPITDVPAVPMLLTPLTESTHVLQVGYGTTGTGLTGEQNIGFLRRIGENMLAGLFSNANYLDTVFPASQPRSQFGTASQNSYWTDFDNPNRTPEEEAGCVFNGGISCNSLAAVFAIDYFDGDALPGEVGTAGGDSGSPLLADELGVDGQGVIIGVLSGGYDIFGLGTRYGDVSFYAPLYAFFEFISENTPYKYVAANAGDGNWSDPTYWTQQLDPGFLIQDANGNLVNGLPGGEEEGIYATGGKFGTILGQDISDADAQNAINLPPEGTEYFGANIPESSVLLGPGSTGFVPNNTDGTPGVSFENPALYFDVTLNREGRTFVDIDVEIDKLVLDNDRARIVIPEERIFTTVIGVEQFAGSMDLDGTLNAGIFTLAGGLLEGTGTVDANVLLNLAGGIAPGDLNKVGTLTIDGDYVQASAGTLVSDVRFRNATNEADLLAVTGNAVLDGNLVVVSNGRPRYGDEATVLTAGGVVDGNFANTYLIRTSPLLFAESRVEGNSVIVSIGAHSVAQMFEGVETFQSLGLTIDGLRFGGRYDEFASLFGVIDGAGVDSLVPTLSSLTPTSAFGQTAMSTGFSRRFTGQIAQRTLSLRGAGKAAGGFSAAGNASFAMANAQDADSGLGMFASVSGSYLNGGEDADDMGALERTLFTEAGELTMGADMEVRDGLSIGASFTSIRNAGANIGADDAGREDGSVAGAAYAAWQSGGAFADAHAGFARQRFGLDRAMQGDFARYFDHASGDSDATQRFAGARIGYAIEAAKGLEMGPVASVDYVRSDMDGYRETGAGQFGLTIHDRRFTSLGTKLGAMASYDTSIGSKGSFKIFGSAAVARELGDSRDVVTASFAGAEDLPFSIAHTLDPQWVSVNAGAQLRLGEDFSMGVSATSDIGRGVLSSDEARVNMSWKF